MYSRTSADDPTGEPRSFGVSGRLWHGVLVMFDRGTESLWTQIDGRAIRGAELGARLTHVPSTFTTWERWRAEHPDTLVLEKPEEERERKESHYAAYFDDPERLWQEHLAEGLGGVEPKDLVFGVQAGGEALAVSEGLLSEKRVVNAVIGGTPIAWLLDDATGFPRVVVRRLEGRVMVLGPEPRENPAVQFRDVLTGETHGPDEVETLRVDRAYWYAWRRSHPSSLILAD